MSSSLSKILETGINVLKSNYHQIIKNKKKYFEILKLPSSLQIQETKNMRTKKEV